MRVVAGLVVGLPINFQTLALDLGTLSHDDAGSDTAATEYFRRTTSDQQKAIRADPPGAATAVARTMFGLAAR